MEDRFNALVETILGSASYHMRISMPGWNMLVNVLLEPKVMARLATFQSWGPAAHLAQAESLITQHLAYERMYADAVGNALLAYGDHGVLVAGIVRAHFPELIKAQLRFLSTAKTVTLDAALAHWLATGRRKVTFATQVEIQRRRA